MNRNTFGSELRQEQGPPSADSEEMQPYEQPYRWVMLALVSLLYMAFGVVNRSLAPLVTPIIADLNISYSQMGIILGAWPLPYIIMAALGGAILDRWGIHKSLFIGILVVGLSGVLRYFANGFTVLFLCVVLFGIGGPMISIGCPKTVSVWFRGKERGTAVGVYTMAPWVGGLIPFLATNSIIMPLTGYSWRLTLVFLSLLCFVAALLWWFLGRDVKSAGATTESAGIVEVFTSLIKIRSLQLILIMGFFTYTINHGFHDWLPKILETGGLTPAVAGFAASVPLLVGIPTVLFVPRVVAPHSRSRAVSLVSLLAAVALFIIAITSGVSLIMGLVLFGATFCLVRPFLMLMLMDHPDVGARYMGSATGIFFGISQVGGFAGPFLIGVIKDFTGSFVMGASFIAGLAVILSIIAFLPKNQTDA